MDIIQEAKEEAAIIKSASEQLGYLHIGEHKGAKLANLISRLVDRLEWKLIDKNTPHDGTMLLLADNRPQHIEDRWVVAGSYEKASKKMGVKKAGWYNQFITGEGEEIYPTHWMPLPLPPVGDK